MWGILPAGKLHGICRHISLEQLASWFAFIFLLNALHRRTLTLSVSCFYFLTFVGGAQSPIGMYSPVVQHSFACSSAYWIEKTPQWAGLGISVFWVWTAGAWGSQHVSSKGPGDRSSHAGQSLAFRTTVRSKILKSSGDLI